MNEEKFISEGNMSILLTNVREGLDKHTSDLSELKQSSESLSATAIKWSEAEGSVKKNLLVYPYADVSNTINGVTFSDNGDGSIKGNGTLSSNDSYFNFTTRYDEKEHVFKDSGEYIITVDVDKEYTGTIRIRLINVVSGSSNVLLDSNINQPISFTYSKTMGVIGIQLYAQATVVLGNVTFYPMIRKSTITDSTYVPYIPDNLELQDQIEEVKENVDSNQSAIADVMNVYGAKNLIPYPYLTPSGYTHYGITYTINDDGSVTANGTNTYSNNSIFSLHQRGNTDDTPEHIVENGQYVLSGCPSDSNGDYYMRLAITRNSVFTNLGIDSGSGVDIEINGDDFIDWGAYAAEQIVVKAGVTVDNVTFYPMLTTKAAYEADSDYARYAKTNIELTADVTELQSSVNEPILTATASPIEDTVEGGLRLVGIDGKTEQMTTTGKNLLKVPSSTVSKTVDGVIFTVNRNANGEVESVVVNGTPTGNYSTLFLSYAGDGVKVGTGSFIGSCCPENGSSTTYGSNFMIYNGDTLVSDNYDYGSGKAFEINNGNYTLAITCTVRSGYTANNLVFKPMIRLATETDPTFEPYTGGTPAPNPSYPQPIKCAVVDKVRSVGKNLAPITLEGMKSINTVGTWSGNTYTVNGITFTVNTDKGLVKSINIKRTTANNGAFFYFFSQEFNIDSDDVYARINSTANSSNADATVAMADDSSKTLKGGSLKTGSINLDIGTVKRFSMYFNTSFTGDLTIYPFIGKADDIYEPYHSTETALSTPIKLYGNDTLKDRIVKIDGLWKVERKYGWTTIDGNISDEEITVFVNPSNTSQERFRIDADVSAVNETSTNHVSNIALLCEDNNANYCWALNNKFAVYNSGHVYLSKIVDTAAALKTFLATTPMHVVYELATPTYETLPDADQKALNSLKTWDGVTNVFWETDVENGLEPDWSAEYGAFKDGAYALQALNNSEVALISDKVPKVYGFHIDGDESDPSEMVSYIEDARYMTPAHMDYTKGVFDYGSWEDVWFVNDAKPCILGQDGVVQAYLDKDDMTKDIYGNTVTIDSTLTGANVMVEFPKIWYKVVPDKDNVKSGSVYISPVKLDAGYKDYAYIDHEGNHAEHFYMSAYNGSNVSNVLRSISGVAPLKSQTGTTEIEYAKANGDGWMTEDAGEVMLINFLLILMGKSTDTQTVFGRGIDTGSETEFNKHVTGESNTKGFFWGSNSGTEVVKVFGIENWWGLQWRRYAGDILVNGVLKRKLCYGNEDGSTTFDFNTTGEGYAIVSDATPSGTNGGYISQMKFTEDGMYSVVSSGSASTYYTDGQWFDNSGTRYALRGGSALYGLRCGALCVHRYAAVSAAWWDAGAAPSYK